MVVVMPAPWPTRRRPRRDAPCSSRRGRPSSFSGDGFPSRAAIPPIPQASCPTSSVYINVHGDHADSRPPIPFTVASSRAEDLEPNSLDIKSSNLPREWPSGNPSGSAMGFGGYGEWRLESGLNRHHSGHGRFAVKCHSDFRHLKMLGPRHPVHPGSSSSAGRIPAYAGTCGMPPRGIGATRTGRGSGSRPRRVSLVSTPPPTGHVLPSPRARPAPSFLRRAISPPRRTSRRVRE